MRLVCFALALSVVGCTPRHDSPVTELEAGYVAPDAEPLGSTEADLPRSPLRFGAFNVRRLGLDPGTDVTLVARVVEQSFDLVAVLEIMQTDAGGHPGLDALLARLGVGWSCLVTESARPLGDSPYAEHVAVLFRPGRARPCMAAERLERYAGDGFLRAPAYACFESIDATGRSGTDFVLVAYHALWGDGSVGPIEREVARLDEALRTVRAAHPDERDVFVVGDFNLPPEPLAKLTRAQLRTRGTGSTLAPSGMPSLNLYDQLLVLDEHASQELVGDAWVLDPRAAVGGPEAYYAHVSDHLPIVALLRTDLGDDD